MAKEKKKKVDNNPENDTPKAPDKLPGIALIEGQPVRYIPVDLIKVHEDSQRLDPPSLAQLKKSIKANGILEPLIVREIPNGYQVVSGNRRLEASKELKLTSVPCLVKDSDETAIFAHAWVSNKIRATLKTDDTRYLAKVLVESLGTAECQRLMALPPKGLERLISPAEIPTASDTPPPSEPVVPTIVIPQESVRAFIDGELTEILQEAAVATGNALVMAILGFVSVTESVEVDDKVVVRWQPIP